MTFSNKYCAITFDLKFNIYLLPDPTDNFNEIILIPLEYIIHFSRKFEFD